MKNKEKLKIWHKQLDKIATYLFGTDRTEQELEEIKLAHQALGYFLEDQICHSYLFDFNDKVAQKWMLNKTDEGVNNG